MQGLRTILSVYGSLFAQMLKVRLAYKGDFLADLFATVLGGVSSLLFVVLLFLRTEELGGWTREEVLFLYGLSMVSYGMFGCVSWNLFDFGDRYIIEGRFDRVLLRPMATYPQILFDSFRLPALGECVVGAGVVVWTAARMEWMPSALDVLALVVTVLGGAVIFLSVFSVLAALAFHFEDRIGIAPPIFNMITFGRYPQTIFPYALRFVLRWIVPFGFVAYYPAEALLGRVGGAGLALVAPVVALAFASFAAAAWRIGVRRYESTGS